MTRFFVKLVITVLLFWVILRETDLDSVWQQVQRLDWQVIISVIVIHLSMALFASVRWYYVLQAIDHALPFFVAWRLVMISTLFNQVLPSAMGGDLLRIPYAHRHGVPLGGAVNAVVLDRLVSLVALILLTLLCLPVAIQVVTEPAAHWTLIGVTLAGMCGTTLLMTLRGVPEALARIAVVKLLLAVSSGLRSALLGGFALRIMAPTLVVHLARVVIVYLIARGMAMGVSLAECVTLVPPAMLITALPVSIGGWGVREGAFIVAFGFVGLPAAQALALSVVFGATMMIAALAGVVPWISSSAGTQQG
jgi:uncharacterized membrane protein YbhN (UPF0104 family)